MATLALPLAHVAHELPGQPVFLADGEALGVVDQVVQVDSEDASRDCLVVIPTGKQCDAAAVLVIPENAVSAVNEDYEVVLRTTRPWVGHYCMASEPGCGGATPSRAERDQPNKGSVWDAIRARIRRQGRR